MEQQLYRNKKMACKFFLWFTSTETQDEVEKFLSTVNVKEDVLGQAYDYWLDTIFMPDTVEPVESNVPDKEDEWIEKLSKMPALDENSNVPVEQEEINGNNWQKEFYKEFYYNIDSLYYEKLVNWITEKFVSVPVYEKKNT